MAELATLELSKGARHELSILRVRGGVSIIPDGCRLEAKYVELADLGIVIKTDGPSEGTSRYSLDTESENYARVSVRASRVSGEDFDITKAVFPTNTQLWSYYSENGFVDTGYRTQDKAAAKEECRRLRKVEDRSSAFLRLNAGRGGTAYGVIATVPGAPRPVRKRIANISVVVREILKNQQLPETLRNEIKDTETNLRELVDSATEYLTAHPASPDAPKRVGRPRKAQPVTDNGANPVDEPKDEPVNADA